MSSGNWKELFDAACAGDLDLVRYHIRSGVNINHIHPEYFGSILVACILAQQQTVALELLENGANPNLYSELDRLTPLQAARQANLTAVQHKLLLMGAFEPLALQPRKPAFRWRLRFWSRRSANLCKAEE